MRSPDSVVFAALLVGATALGSMAVQADMPTPSLEVIVLGSGGPGATGRAGGSYLVLIDGTPRIVVDAGPGATVRIGEEGLSLEQADIVLLTHLHVDHAAGLPAVLKARAVSGGDDSATDVFGPGPANRRKDGAEFPSTRRFIDLLFGTHGEFSYLPTFAAPLTIRAHDIAGREAGFPRPRVIYTKDGIVIRAVNGHHGDAPAVIYRIDYAGRSVTFSGDIDAQGWRALGVIARDSDLLVFNAVVRDPPGSPPVLYQLHTAPSAIGDIAQNAHVHKLLLSHLSPDVTAHRDEVTESVRQRYTGPLEFAEYRLHVRVEGGDSASDP